MTTFAHHGCRAARVRRPRQRAARVDAPAAECERLAQTWRTTFFEALAETSNVARACQAAGVGQATVYDLKRRDLGFAERWGVALAEGYDNLEMELLDRLRNGEGGDLRYNYAVAVRALQAHREAVTRERGRRAAVDGAASRASMLAKLEKLRDQVLAEAAAAADPARDEAGADAGA